MNTELIIKKYTKNKESILKIANDISLSRYKVRKVLVENGIIIKTQQEICKVVAKNRYKLKEYEHDIVDKYQNGLSISKLAIIYCVTRPVIRRILKNNHISIRTARETSILQFKKNINISIDLISKINGWLLGDGSIEGVNQGCFKIPSKHEQYIDYIKNILESNGFTCNKYVTYDYNTNKYYHRLTTHSYIELGQLKKLWYQEKKRVPSNLNLTTDTIKIWIMDDGTLCKRDKCLTFCTHGFVKDDCLLLCDKLNKLIGCNQAKINKDGKYYKIRLGKLGTKILYNKLGPCEIECFKYKWLDI